LFPATLRGWTVRELPLGPSEGVTGQIEKTLGFDDVLYREYARPGMGIISVYVAYWGPGKMPAQLVASHTPDRCWTEAGWVCQAQRHEVPTSVGGETLRPAQERLFENAGARKQHVLFWHLVGEQLYDYGDRFYYVPSPWKWWRDAARQMWGRPQEQYFVRLASNEPWESLQNETGLVGIAEGLRGLGLVVERGAGK
jgi:hypothetical protein